MDVADKRGRKLNEIISGIKVIKFTAWEKIMNGITKQYRDQEGKQILRAFTLYNFSHSIGTLIPTILSVLIFLLHDKYNEEKLSTTQIFELITLFNATLMPIRFYIMAIMSKADANAASLRMSIFGQVETRRPLEDHEDLRTGELLIKDGNFNWEDPHYAKIFENKDLDAKKKSNYILKNINIHIQPGDFVAVVGKVGSGKSSLLLSLMNEMVSHAGTKVQKNGEFAYISQEAFLQNETIKNNITFAKKYDEDKFAQVLESCQILPDLEILPGREETEIGERGVNMSGGQKQRINIARALYSDSDIYLIDDALSALDAYVGKKIMENVFCKDLAGKTRVMVTHHLSLLEGNVNKVVLLQNGEIVQSGKYEDVKKTKEFQDFARAAEKEVEAPTETPIVVETDIDNLEKKNVATVQNTTTPLNINVDHFSSSKQTSVLEVKPSSILEITENNLTKDSSKPNNVVKVIPKEKAKVQNSGDSDAGKLVNAEERDTGSVGLKYYIYYMSQAGAFLCTLCIIFFAMSILFKMSTDWFIGKWSSGEFNDRLTEQEQITIIMMLGLVALVFLVIRAIALGYVNQLASVNIFKLIVWNILRRPMSFFDTTPSGVIINRCTNDVDQLDFEIPWQISFLFNTIFNYAGALILTAVISPIVILFILIALISLYKSFSLYMNVSIELKRMIQVSAAPMISLASELIEGVIVIRNYNKRGDMLVKYAEKSDDHHSVFFHDQQLNLWIRSRMEYYLAFVVSFTMFSIVVSRQIP